MEIQKQLKADLIGAMKGGEAERTMLIRSLLASLHNREIEKQGKGVPPELSSEEEVEVLRREVKKRHEAAELFQQGGRSELAEKERREASLIGAYLPALMEKDDILKVVAKLRASGLNDFSSLIREAMKELKGKADGKAVGEVIRAQLES